MTSQRTRRTDGQPKRSPYKNFEPPNLTKQSYGLYHWAPEARRKGILRSGLLPGSKSHAVDWRPPYVCFSLDPDMAWQLSGRMYPGTGVWDLWMTWTTVPSGIDLCIDFSPHLDGHYIKEVRIYERIFKRDVWYVGSREA